MSQYINCIRGGKLIKIFKFSLLNPLSFSIARRSFFSEGRVAPALFLALSLPSPAVAFSAKAGKLIILLSPSGLIKMALRKPAERSGRKIYGRRCYHADSSEGTVSKTPTIDIYILQRSAAGF
jgi:hypothetical protein